MDSYRQQLPQLDELFLTDGGAETTLIFRDGQELPEFAAFDLLKDEQGSSVLRKYFRQYAELAHRYNANFILDSVTWRANPDWGTRLGYSEDQLRDMNRRAIDLLTPIREEFVRDDLKMVISGAIGPRGDGYVPTDRMTTDEAAEYHGVQISSLAETDADMVTAYTLNYAEEAIGIALAAKRHGLPAVISFTVETDGRLPTGQSMEEAIEAVDEATDESVAYYMINCAHVNHFLSELSSGLPWVDRIGGIRGNASKLSHAELDEMETLDEGDPEEFGDDYRKLTAEVSHLKVLGGCCGTDHRHIEAVCQACFRE